MREPLQGFRLFFQVNRQGGRDDWRAPKLRFCQYVFCAEGHVWLITAVNRIIKRIAFLYIFYIKFSLFCRGHKEPRLRVFEIQCSYHKLTFKCLGIRIMLLILHVRCIKLEAKLVLFIRHLFLLYLHWLWFLHTLIKLILLKFSLESSRAFACFTDRLCQSLFILWAPLSLLSFNLMLWLIANSRWLVLNLLFNQALLTLIYQWKVQ